jgi:hypothetical protein
MSTLQILTQEACSRKIDQIARVGGKLHQVIHEVAVSSLAHVRDHGNTTLVARLLNAMPAGQRTKALVVWFDRFSGGAIKAVKGKGGYAIKTLPKDRTADQFEVDAAYRTSYDVLTSEKDPKPMGFEALLKYLSRIANEERELPDGQPKVTADARMAAARCVALLQVEPAH